VPWWILVPTPLATSWTFTKMTTISNKLLWGSMVIRRQGFMSHEWKVLSFLMHESECTNSGTTQKRVHIDKLIIYYFEKTYSKAMCLQHDPFIVLQLSPKGLDPCVNAWFLRLFLYRVPHGDSSPVFTIDIEPKFGPFTGLLSTCMP
jgi:hypothetical protein